MTNIVRPDIIQGVEARAESVLRKCTESIGSYLDVYVSSRYFNKVDVSLTEAQVTLHCYALDCASHFLFSPGGTDTLNNPDDLILMQELSYDNSLKRK
jgi:hypothetical protein